MKVEDLLKKIVATKKIAVFGWPATGKTTFSSKLFEILQIPLYELDEIRWKYFQDGKKDDEKFLMEYNEILSKPKWIIEGNALDWIDSRLKIADILFFFDSTVEKSIDQYHRRRDKLLKEGGADKISNKIHAKNPTEFDIWVKTRFSKKIENLRPVLENYKDKIYIVKDFSDVDEITKEIEKIIIQNAN